MRLDVNKDDYGKADDLAYEKIMSIFTVISLNHRGKIGIEEGTLCAIPIPEDRVWHEEGENGENIKVISASGAMR